MRNVGIYVHIPFCKRKCYYCDFISYDNKNEKIEEYIKYLKYEIYQTGEGSKLDVKNNLIEPLKISSIYIGGGTPSYIDSKYIVEIIELIKKEFELYEDAEITIEINPGTVDKQKLLDYKNIGINRLSIGVQSNSNTLLNDIGRIHSYEEFLSTYNLAREIGFNNINLDFIIGLPNQKDEDIDNLIKEIERLSPEHISIYSLMIEENTKMYKDYIKNIIKLPNEDIERQTYWKIKRNLENDGYLHYEISNFAKYGYESKHNLACWNQEEYIGFGVAAHSYTDGARYSNIANIDEYIDNFKNNKDIDNIIFHEKQNNEMKMKEYMFLGFRKIKGVNIDQFYNKFKEDVFDVFSKELSKLIKIGLIEINDNYIKLTNRGLDLANLVFEEFC